jgi:hypothetical protein
MFNILDHDFLDNVWAVQPKIYESQDLAPEMLRIRIRTKIVQIRNKTLHGDYNTN